MKEVKLSEDGKHLVDSDEIIFKRPKPLSTIEVRVSTADSIVKVDYKKDFVEAIENFPDTNAYLNLGMVPEKLETEEREHGDPNVGFIITNYRFYKVELYHLGE